MAMTSDHTLLSLAALALLVAGIVGVVRVLHKAGRSGFWVLLLALPLVNLAMVWWFAYARWPALEEPGESAAPPHTSGPV